MAMCRWARCATSRSGPSAACWKELAGFLELARVKELHGRLERGQLLVRRNRGAGVSALEAGSECLGFSGAWGFVMRLSVFLGVLATVLFFSAMVRTQDGYIRPRPWDATGAAGYPSPASRRNFADSSGGVGLM